MVCVNLDLQTEYMVTINRVNGNNFYLYVQSAEGGWAMVCMVLMLTLQGGYWEIEVSVEKS